MLQSLRSGKRNILQTIHQNLEFTLQYNVCFSFTKASQYGYQMKRINTISGRNGYILVFMYFLHYNNQCAWKCETKHSRGRNTLLFIFGAIKRWWR